MVQATEYKPTHAQLQKAISDYLTLTGWMVWHNRQGLGSYKGIPDLTAVKNDCTLWIEVKTEGTDLSREQRKFRDDMLPHTGPHLKHVLARSVDDVIRAVG
ncbi:MAG: hypothetical protein C4570_06500 [Ammonifex sp.]|jgi:hypothetical protein|nr:MAG: hypothetical protein C4570_06500 [Ammonifex sp.]